MELELAAFRGMKGIDVVGLFYGYKDIISTGLVPRLAGRLEIAFRRYGFVFDTLGEKYDYRERNPTYIISKSAASIKEAIEAYRAERYDIVGRMLGYPRCCVKRHYKLVRARGAKDDFVRKCALNSSDFFWPINNILDFDGRLCGKSAAWFDLSDVRHASLISHNPCSYDCKPSLGIAERNCENLRKNTRHLWRGNEYSVLAKPVLYADDFNLAILNGVSGPAGADYRGAEYVLGFDKFREKISAGDRVIVRGKDFLVSRNGKMILRVTLPKKPLLLSFDRHSRPAGQAPDQLNAAFIL